MTPAAGGMMPVPNDPGTLNGTGVSKGLWLYVKVASHVLAKPGQFPFPAAQVNCTVSLHAAPRVTQVGPPVSTVTHSPSKSTGAPVPSLVNVTAWGRGGSAATTAVSMRHPPAGAVAGSEIFPACPISC